MGTTAAATTAAVESTTPPAAAEVPVGSSTAEVPATGEGSGLRGRSCITATVEGTHLRGWVTTSVEGAGLRGCVGLRSRVAATSLGERVAGGVVAAGLCDAIVGVEAAC